MKATNTPPAVISWSVAPEGMGAFQCNYCDEFFTVDESLTIAKVGKTQCQHCGHQVLRATAKTHIFFDQREMLNEAHVRQEVWYHVSPSAHWKYDLTRSDKIANANRRGGMPESHVMVHIGSLDAALTRYRDYVNAGIEDLYFYRIRLNDDAEICENILPDENEDCPNDSLFCVKNGYSTSITRYVNSFESPGSVSLLANHTAFTIINQVQL